MSTIIFAVVSVTAIGVICAVMLAVASKVMAVEVDERAGRITELLPGANCGACGFAGCPGYAEALISEDGVKSNLCVPGGDAVSRQISELLGVEFEDVIEQIAVVHCCGDCDAQIKKMEYVGIKSCEAAKQLFGGQSACTYGCLGYGDCANACPNGAICVENGLARINTKLCTGCGLCAKTCPNGIIYTENDTITTVVLCKNIEKGTVVRTKCSRGCVGCKKCERECPAGAISVENNLAKIDYVKCIGCARCAEVCTTNSIRQASFSGIFRSQKDFITI